MDRCSACPTLAYSHGLCRRHYTLAKRAGTLPTLAGRLSPFLPGKPAPRFVEPLLRCRCGRTYREHDAYRAAAGRWRDHLCGPCRHPLQDASYIDPQSGAVLVPWAA